MKSNRGSISIFMLLIVPIIAIGIFILYDHLRSFQLDNQVLKNARNISEIQLSNNNAHLFDSYGLLAYLDQDIIESQLVALNEQVSISNIEVDHFNLGIPAHFVEATKLASRNIIALEAVNQIRALIDPYLKTEQSSVLRQQIKMFEEKAERFFNFHNTVKNIEKLKTTTGIEAILKSIENDIANNLNDLINSYETLLQSETSSIHSQIQKYEILMMESTRTSDEWAEKILELRQINEEIVTLRHELEYFDAEIDRKTVELENYTEFDEAWDSISDELSNLLSQKTESAYELSMREEKWINSINRIVANYDDSKPMLLNKIAQLSNTIDKMLFELDPIEDLSLPSDHSDLEQLDADSNAEMNMLDGLIYAEYWMGVLKSFDKGSVRNFNPLGNKMGRDSVINGEVEYLLVGKLADLQNVQVIKMRIFSMRTIANMIHIASDATKTAQIGRVTAVLPVPWNTMAYGAMVTLWSSAEGYLDMIALFKGEGHHFIKKEMEWQLSFDHLMQGTLTPVAENYYNKTIQPKDSKLYYQDYLRFMLYVQPVEVTAKRGMLLLNANIRKVSENSFDLTQFSTGHKIEIIYLIKGLIESNTVMSMVNEY